MRFVRFAAALSIACVAATGSVSLSEPQKYGAGVSIEAVTPLNAIIEKPAEFAGKTVRVEGTVTAVCTHEGCWMTLAPEGQTDAPTLRLKVDDGVIVFPVTAIGKKAVAQGVVEQAGTSWQIEATGALVY
jgi:hypothetical protein